MGVKQDIVNEIFKPRKKKFPRRRVKIKGLNDLIEIDLMDMSKNKKTNSGITFILTAVNAFSKYGFGVGVKNKGAVEVKNALIKILDNSKALIGKEIQNIHHDKGTEFYNKHVQELFKQRNINSYSTNSPIKCSMVERFNRTLKNRIYREILLRSTTSYYQYLPAILENYNNTWHRTIKCTPIEASKPENENEIFNRIYNVQLPLLKPKYKVGDQVRIVIRATTFTRGYQPSFSPELYKIYRINRKFPILYELKNYDGEIIKQRFYEPEIVKAKHKDVFLIRKILERRKNKIKIAWEGYENSRHPYTWEDAKNIVDDN